MVRYLAFSLILALLAMMPAAAQSDDDFGNELSYGINFNSNAGLIGGAFFRSSHYVRDDLYQLWGLEIVEVKHPKETRWYNGQTGDFFILGKQNYLFVLRPHYGAEYVLFRKAAESGVQVNAVGAAGPSIGLLVPYYIHYNYGGAGGNDVRTEQYDPKQHPISDNIQGNANLFTGLGETSIKPGLHAKAGLSFEYGRYKESITGIEVGFLVEQYFSKVVIIPEAENYSTFASVYLNIYYGRRR